MTSIARRLDDDRRRLVVVSSKPLIAQLAYLLLDLAELDSGGQRVVRLGHTTMAQLSGRGGSPPLESSVRCAGRDWSPPATASPCSTTWTGCVR